MILSFFFLQSHEPWISKIYMKFTILHEKPKILCVFFDGFSASEFLKRARVKQRRCWELAIGWLGMISCANFLLSLLEEQNLPEGITDRSRIRGKRHERTFHQRDYLKDYNITSSNFSCIHLLQVFFCAYPQGRIVGIASSCDLKYIGAEQICGGSSKHHGLGFMWVLEWNQPTFAWKNCV